MSECTAHEQVLVVSCRITDVYSIGTREISLRVVLFSCSNGLFLFTFSTRYVI